jgi:ATP-binding cassette subfamily D (ALD) protein 3
MMFAIPASFVNSYLEYLNKELAHHFKEKLTAHLNSEYLSDLMFF